KDKIILLLILLVPALYTLLFGAVYFSAVLTGIPLAVVDLDRSGLSREVIAAFSNSPKFEVLGEISTYEELREGMKTGAVRAGVVIPEDFEKKALLRRGTKVLTVYDASNLIWGYNTRKYALEVINHFSTAHTAAYLAGLGMTGREIKNILDTVSCNLDVWYNPTYSYTTYLFLGLVLMIIHQICLLGVSLTVTREKDRNSWVQYLGAALPRWKIFLGKCLPYLAANFFNYVLLLWLSARLINVKAGGSMGLILLLGFLYGVIITAAGFYFSALAPNSLQVTRYVILLSVPLFIISGYTWPMTHIPGLVEGPARLLPYTWMAEAMRAVTVKNLGCNYVRGAVVVLAAMSFLSVLLAANFSRRRKPPRAGGPAINGGAGYPHIK
ncbi:MAG: ABC-type multidrug transport system, permease component, partial [Pelotomaculum thermopropionicum]